MTPARNYRDRCPLFLVLLFPVYACLRFRPSQSRVCLCSYSCSLCWKLLLCLCFLKRCHLQYSYFTVSVFHPEVLVIVYRKMLVQILPMESLLHSEVALLQLFALLGSPENGGPCWIFKDGCCPSCESVNTRITPSPTSFFLRNLICVSIYNRYLYWKQ